MTLGYAGNGNVLTAADSVNGSWTYTYDGVNRLGTALWPTQASFSYSYDRYGNMSCVQNIQGGQPCAALSYSASTNRLSGYSYDDAGNLLSDGVHQYHYDGENQLDCVDNLDANRNCTVNSVRYAYDPQGRRVGKQQLNTLEEYVYDPAGNLTSVHDGSGNLVRWELYAGGRHVATRDSSGTLSWNHADWLGTERVRTSSTGTVSEQCTDTPFGMNVHCTTTDLSPMHFTGKQRDPETTYAASDHLDGLDYFGARYYGGGNHLGRFMTPDPAMVVARIIGAPQRWNRYAYVVNNPLGRVDPDGAEDITVIFMRDNVSSKSTTGRVYIYGGGTSLEGKYLEPGKKGLDAIHPKGRIPSGTYNAVFKPHLNSNANVLSLFRFSRVPGFEGIYAHNGNWATDTSGCFLYGTTLGDDFVGNSNAFRDEALRLFRGVASDNDKVIDNLDIDVTVMEGQWDPAIPPDPSSNGTGQSDSSTGTGVSCDVLSPPDYERPYRWWLPYFQERLH